MKKHVQMEAPVRLNDTRHALAGQRNQAGLPWLQWLSLLLPGQRARLTIASFLLPLALWSLVSYVPFIWHPKMEISNPGKVDYFQPGMLVDKAVFQDELAGAKKNGDVLPEGRPANPVYLPSPVQVGKAFFAAFQARPIERDGLWLHQSVWKSIQIIFWGFLISSVIGIPLGILCGTYKTLASLCEPFIEFFRYLPAPAFGALAVAILGIYDGPKIAIIVIGTLFQQILIVANTARKLDYSLIEAARTLGTKPLKLLTRVVIPGILPELYRDQRILLGWAWTYLIVAELIGTSSGITWYITQQARYQHFENVYAAIMLIGIIGFGTDLVLARIGRRLFPWDEKSKS